MFGRSSEAPASQGRLFNEAELEADGDSDDEDAALTETAETESPPKPSPAKRRGKRRPLPPELPRITQVVDVPDDPRQRDYGTPMLMDQAGWHTTAPSLRYRANCQWIAFPWQRRS